MENEALDAPVDGIDANVAQAIISILETTNSPAIQRAREVIAYRLAISGDVAPSRIPAPRNISEIGGYINLLTEYGETEQRSRMIAAALGIAGPHVNLPQPGAPPALSFATRTQPRPEGPQQPSFPLTFAMRTDFLPAFDTALQTIANFGAAMPILTNTPRLPSPGAAAPAGGDEQLRLIGRLISLAPTAALRDASTDPLSLTRPTAGGAFQVMARVIDPGAPDAGTLPDTDWTSWECDMVQCSETDTTDARVGLTPILAAAGWHQSGPPQNPTTVTDTGSWNIWRNLTGLVPGTSRFGDELGLLFTADELVVSPVFDQLDYIWDGTQFVAS